MRDDGTARFNIYIGDEGALIGIVADLNTWQAYLLGSDIEIRRMIRRQIEQGLEAANTLFKPLPKKKEILLNWYSEEEVKNAFEENERNIQKAARALDVKWNTLRDFLIRRKIIVPKTRGRKIEQPVRKEGFK